MKLNPYELLLIAEALEEKIELLELWLEESTFTPWETEAIAERKSVLVEHNKLVLRITKKRLHMLSVEKRNKL